MEPAGGGVRGVGGGGRGGQGFGGKFLVVGVVRSPAFPSPL